MLGRLSRMRSLVSASLSIGGFTLVEMAMVTLIGGLVMATAGSAMVSFLDQARVDTTRVRMEGIENALKQYLQTNNKYPCPARLNLQQNNADYGREVNQVCTTAPAVGEVTFRVRGRDIDGAGPGVPQNVRVGAVPTRSLNLPDTYMTDGWGNRFYFAMTEELASPTVPAGSPFQTVRGGVVIGDGVTNAPANLVTLNLGAHYALISPGPNRTGAYNMNGIQAIPCAAELPNVVGVPPAGTTVEASNCTFQNPPGTAPKLFRSTLNTATAGGANTYDDYVTFRTSSSANIALPPCGAGQVRVGDLCQVLPAAPPNCAANQVRVENTCRTVPNCTPPAVVRWTGSAFACATVNPPAAPATACPQSWQIRSWNGTSWVCTEPPRGTLAGYYGEGVGGFVREPAYRIAVPPPVQWAPACRPGWTLTILGERSTTSLSVSRYYSCTKD